MGSCMGILILAMFVMVMMSMVVVIFVIVMMMLIIMPVHILQPVAFAAPVRQNIQNAVLIMITAEISWSHGSAD